MKKEKTLWIIGGPTASGKTDAAIRLAKETGSPILSADSRQIYNEVSIGVAKPDTEQLNAVPHHFINHINIHENYNAGRYASEARILVNALFDQHDTLIVCGGTGLYINALLKGLDPLPERDELLRQELEDLMKKEGISALQELLSTLNPEKAGTMDLQNPQRLIRAIEIEKSTKLSTVDIPEFKHAFEVKTLNIDLPRAELYERINHRVDLMIQAGLEAEAERLKDLQHLNALQTVGYSEWWPYFRGETSKAEVIDKIKQHTRNYAKRQLTWIRGAGKR